MDQKRKVVLLPSESNIIVQGEWLTDTHMDHFGRLLRNCSNYKPVETWRVQCPDTIEPVPVGEKHIQILHSSSGPCDGHWVCCFYDTKNIFIYDSLNRRQLHAHHERFLKRLFPAFSFNTHRIKFPIVQQQPNGNDCGVFAIAFAISLVFNIKPERVTYDHKVMRSHLLKIFESNIIEHFPQDSRYSMPQHVFPLAVVATKELETLRKRNERLIDAKQKEMKATNIYSKTQIKNDTGKKVRCIEKSIVENNNKNNKNQHNITLVNHTDNSCSDNIYINGNHTYCGNRTDTNHVHCKNNENNSRTNNINNNAQCETVPFKVNGIQEQDRRNAENHRRRQREYYEDNSEKISSDRRNKYKERQETLRAQKCYRYKKHVDSNRANKRDCYKKNVEIIRAKKRDRYNKNSETILAKQRDRYNKNSETIRAKKRDRYNKNSETIRAKQRDRYNKNSETIRAKKRDRYNKDSETIRAQKRKRYEEHCVEECAKKRKLYSINSEKERKRQRINNNIHSNRKSMYNRTYYIRKNMHSTVVMHKNTTALKIRRKYDAIRRSSNTIRIRGSAYIFVENISEKLNLGKCKINSRLEAEQIVRWCMHVRNDYIQKIYKILTSIKKKSEVCLSLVNDCYTNEEKLHALCGISRHTASSENFYMESAYKHTTLPKPLISNTKGHIVNVLPLIQAKANKSWMCDGDSCKTDDANVINGYQRFLEAINVCTLKNLPTLLERIHKCTVKTSNLKLGHTHACYLHPQVCRAMSLPINLLSPHFPKVRHIRRLIYTLTRLHKNVVDVDSALYSADLSKLNEIAIAARKQAEMYKQLETQSLLTEEDIVAKYLRAFKVLMKRSMDTPRNVCVSCERLCYRRNMKEISKLRIPVNNLVWSDLMKHAMQHNNKSEYICDYCVQKIRQNVMPAYCVLNSLSTEVTPEIISSLNTFEKMLIQRAKAFQTVLKMGTVMNNKLPHRQMVQKVKGRTFHLPLPLEETLKKLCAETEPLNSNYEVYILVRGIPTKTKIVWEEMVDVKKVFDALTWLKCNNPLYSHIALPETCDKLDLNELNIQQFQVQDANDENKRDTDLPNDHAAMLTQITEEKDTYYEQFTIYPLYEKRSTETATALYQMLKIADAPLDNREKKLDLLCFPDLYPFGINGQHENRKIKLHDHEFIKSRLMSKHPQFRLNQQYLFYLLNNANMRQLSRGIFHKMHISNPRERYTAAQYLEAMSKEMLESNLNTIFSTLRNTEQYWRRPRSNLNCMTQHYGPATWFLTLSPSEWLWEDLGDYIREVNGWTDSSLSISVLVAKDPVSTSRFLDNKFHAMLDFICSPDHPIGEVTHYFWRREYQGRGVQHFHLLLWIKNAPILNESSTEEVCKFILQHVTCKMPKRHVSPLLHSRVNTHQQHKHNGYCLRSKTVGRRVVRVCRFGFPRPATETIIMRDIVTSVAGRKKLKQRSRLYDLPRTNDEVSVNDYNPILLTAWEGNMDIQFIGEKSSLLTWYITKYLNKAGKSELSDCILKSNSDKNKSLASYLWNVALRFTNNRECGALEAADTLLGISLYGTDPNTTIKWLDVNQIRYRKLKTRTEIEALDGESVDIFCPSVTDDYYPNRPAQLESASLYDFAKWYDVTKIKPRNEFVEFYEIGNGKYLKRRQRGYLINHYRFDVNSQPENYFFSLLFMFKPWRQLEDLKNGCDSYTEAFQQVSLHLTEALQYHEKLEELKKAFDIAKELVQQCLNEKSQIENISQDNPDNPIGVQNIEAGEAMQDFKDYGNKVPDEIDVSNMILQLNVDQKRVFDRVTDAVTSENILRLYVSGEGGTGKSFLIKTIKCWIKHNLGKDTAVAAPTGIAALNIDGLTVHRLLQLPVEHGHTPKYKQLSDHVLKVLRADLKNVVLLIIDEVSMISNITLMFIHLRLSEIFNTENCNDGWFGKKHILLFGDLLQLPPVHEDSAFVTLSNSKIDKYLGSLGGINLWTSLLEYDELTINMRQKGDDSYRQLLSRVRVGLLTNSDTQTLESRKISFTSDSLESVLNEICNFINTQPSDTVCLLPTCNMCDILNAAMLNRISSKEITLIAEDTVDCSLYVKKKVLRLLSDSDDHDSRTAGLSKNITIKIGAKVMIRRNIDVSLGLVNGTIATVVSVIRDTSDYIEKIKILLPSKMEYMIERVSVKFQVMDKAFVIRKQFPLTLSYGITIHKSQGLSLTNAVMDIGNSVFSCGQVYVALSRVTSLQGLHLINYDPSSIKASEEAIIEYNRLKRIYKSHTVMINISKDNRQTTKDTVWALSKQITNIQETHPVIQHNVDWIAHGFKNPDNVSCYANSVMQCLLNLSTFRQRLFTSKHGYRTDLGFLAHQYEHGMHELNTFKIRQCLGEYFSEPVKRDAADFVRALCAKYDDVRCLTEHQVDSTHRCTNCCYTTSTINSSTIISIPINILEKKSYNLQELIRITFSHWQQSNDICCEQCGKNDTLLKKEMKDMKDIVIIHFMSLQNAEIGKVSKFNLCGVPTTKLQIDSHLYRVMSVILHHGMNIQHGHYTSMCREGNSNVWIQVYDDQIIKKQWPKGAKNVCILFLQKITFNKRNQIRKC